MRDGSTRHHKQPGATVIDQYKCDLDLVSQPGLKIVMSHPGLISW